MAFCTQCGEKLEEGVVHSCSNQQSDSSISSKLDVGNIMNLIKNPFLALQLNEQNSLIYGLSGIGVAILGVFLWILSIFNVMSKGFSNIPFIGTVIKPNYFILLLIAFFSIGFLVLFIHIIFNWQGSSKQSFKQAVTSLGATQWGVALLILISILLSFIDGTISVFLFYIIFFVDIALLLGVSTELYKVEYSSRFMAIGLSIFIYMVVNGLVLKSMIGEMFKSLTNFGGGF